MRNFILIVFTVFFISKGMSQELSLMTYNIRLDIASDGENAWPNRKEFLVSQLQFYSPDIFGIQEGRPNQVAYINKQLTAFSFIGEGRDGGDNGEYSAIFYNKKKYKMIEQGTFWLSETPHEIGLGWDAAYPRVCTYGLFENIKEGTRFWVFNTHLDHIGEIARVEGLQLVLTKMKALNTDELPTFLMGDFNAEPTSNPISIVKNEMRDSKEIATEELIGSVGTFNDFQYDEISTQRIDYIFVSNTETIEVKTYGVLNNSKDLKFPSDHFPVFVKIKLEKTYI
ncbi:endonuclease/exonuclease/phosphatase family protein [Formosa sp. PL04]|uniref:endonuclease/exonuclease/phosphatase family protein n=1 Tax=Formosa sp. PL04 TaxID=3081755 RepID=UPI002982134A|nr:endonuclease/exonuclease/phosphatase family protein [Formosa sp. PL04]MDW5287551.1 endonuclease/exonuclease/phosphatase family protein [Formosa sp. PL04]